MSAAAGVTVISELGRRATALGLRLEIPNKSSARATLWDAQQRTVLHQEQLDRVEAKLVELEGVDAGVVDAEVVDADAVWDFDTAREKTRQIQRAHHDLAELVLEAWRHRVWVPLDYDSWDAWTADNHLPRLPIPERRGMVRQLTDNGMSTRAIGSAVGTSEKTVRNDLAARAEDVRTSAADDATITGLDGKQYSRSSHKPSTSRSRQKTVAWKALMRVEALEAQAAMVVHESLGTLDETVTPEVAGDLRRRLDAALRGLRPLKAALVVRERAGNSR